METAWDSEAKHQTSHWRSANGALRAHLTSGKNGSKDRSRNGAQTPSGHDGNVIADDGKRMQMNRKGRKRRETKWHH